MMTTDLSPALPSGVAGTADAPPIAADVLKDDFGWALGVVLRAYIRSAEAVVGDIPGGPRGLQVLSAAAQGTASNQGVMAQQLGIDRTVLTYLIDDLESAGLVRRQANPNDRRNRRVVTTEHGQTLWEHRRDALRHVEEHILAGLGDDGPGFRELLQRLAVQADQPTPTTSACEVIEQLVADDCSADTRTQA
jgi:DNA-binding MarR family transcriptional regulator